MHGQDGGLEDTVGSGQARRTWVALSPTWSITTGSVFEVSVLC